MDIGKKAAYGGKLELSNVIAKFALLTNLNQK
jgi:hypothetical protein